MRSRAPRFSNRGRGSGLIPSGGNGWRVLVRRTPGFAGEQLGYDAKEFVQRCRALGVTPHIAQRKRGSAIDRRTTRHAGYAASIKLRRLIEKVFGWMKAAAAFRRTRYRGRSRTAFAANMVAATYNLIRLSRLQAGEVG